MRSVLSNMYGLMKKKQTLVNYISSPNTRESIWRRTDCLCVFSTRTPHPPTSLASHQPRPGWHHLAPSSKSSQSQNISCITPLYHDFVSAEIIESTFIKLLYKKYTWNLIMLNLNRKFQHICLWLTRSSYEDMFAGRFTWDPLSIYFMIIYFHL